MPPQADEKVTDLLDEIRHVVNAPPLTFKKTRLVWSNIILFIIFHIGGLYGFYAIIFKIKWLTFIYGEKH